MEQDLQVEVQEQVEVWAEAAAEAEWVATDPVQAREDSAFVPVVEQRCHTKWVSPVTILTVPNVAQGWSGNKIRDGYFCSQW